MSAIPIGYAMHLRHLAGDLITEAQRMDRAIAHRDMWLEKAGNVTHVSDAYARTIDGLADRVAAKAGAIKEALLGMQGAL